MYVGGTPGIVMIAPRVGPRLDGQEAVEAVRIGRGAAGPREVRIERRRMVVPGVEITSGRVGLPDLDQRVSHGMAVCVDDTAVHDNAFAKRLARVLPRKIVVGLGDRTMSKERAGELR